MRNPFSAGRWVCGDQFFGRENLIRSLLEGNETCDWIIGKRRVGKTSLLRQLERGLNDESPTTFGLYWDIQGSFDSSGLLDSLIDAIEDNQDLFEDAWENLDIDPDAADSCPQLLKRLARSLQKEKRKFYLLIDEAEELINIGAKDPSLLKKLRRFFQSSQNTHTIITSTPRLEQLYSTMETETSPFLHGFTVSFLGHLTREEGDRLLARGFDRAEEREKLFRLTDGNPFETQLLAKHYFENPSLDAVLAHLESNPMLNQTIEVNLDLLRQDERAMLSRLHQNPQEQDSCDKSIISKLLHMGYLRQAQPDRLEVGSWFQARYLGLTPNEEPESEPVAEQDSPLFEQKQAVVLSHILELYRALLDACQQGKQPDLEAPEAIVYSAASQSITLVDKPEHFKTLEVAQRPWVQAVQTLTAHLDYHLGEIESWPYFRMKEMLNNDVQQYTEKDFIDLMLLIAEEAALEARMS